MRIAFLCKRRYMGKDVVLDRYGRLYEVPYQLSACGHDVLSLCLGYRGEASGQWLIDTPDGRLEWQAFNGGALRVAGLPGYPCKLLRQISSFEPDVLIGASDIPHAVLTAWLARRLGKPYVIDLYDNFEGFGQARLPGFVAALRRAVRGAALVTTTSEPLAEWVRDSYRVQGPILSLPSAVDLSVFHPRDRDACRAGLGLPVRAQLIGTAGGLFVDRGITALYDAWRQLAAENPDLHLVLAGPYDQPPPQNPRVHYLGLLPHAKTAELFAALDVGVLYLRDTPFGRYCFPQKAYEMLAAGLPVVATDVGAVGRLFAGESDCLYAADDTKQLAACLASRLLHPRRSRVVAKDWVGTVAELDVQLRQLFRSPRLGR